MRRVAQCAVRGAMVAGLVAAVTACGYVPRGHDAVDQSFYLAYCAPHEPKFAENAAPIGSEDMTMDSKGVLYISSNDYRVHWNTVPLRAGAIYRYDVAGDGTVEAMKIRSVSNRLPAYFEKNFFPHGISLLESGGEKRLFVINHRLRPGDRPSDPENLANKLNLPVSDIRQSFVEIFRIERDGASEILVHEKTVLHDDELKGGSDPRGGRDIALNDLVAVGKQQFLATNNPRGLTQAINIGVFRNPIGNLVYYDGTAYRVVRDRVDYGNGINVSADNGILYLATMRNGEVIAYRTNLKPPGEAQPAEVTLEEIAPRVRLGGHLDNLEWADARRREMLVASHDNLAAFGLKLFLDAPVDAPSRIMRLRVGDDGKPVPESAEMVYANDGAQVSAASVAAYFKDKRRERLIIGSVFDQKFFVCKLDAH